MNYSTYFSTPQYGPYAPPQGRFDQMGGNPSQSFPVQQAQAAPQPAGFLVRPVTSREEAVAAQIDFLGPGTLMPDLSHGTIYLKRFNPQTGASDFYTFTMPAPEPEPAPVEYATKEELRSLREEIEQLRGRKGTKKNEQPDE